MAAPLLPERSEHRGVVALLAALDGTVLARHGVVFAGGTRIALAFGEYRLSRDADFLAVDRTGYASLRAEVREQGGVERLFSNSVGVAFPREPRVDRYGIRFPVLVEGEQIKVEFVAEGRIELEAGEPGPFSSVPWASITDCFAEKLLANSDRWLDDVYLSRDLVDLAALRSFSGPIPADAWRKAEGAYGPSVVSDLARSIRRFLSNAEYQHRCFERLQVLNAEVLIDGMKTLEGEVAQRLSVEPD